MTQSPMVEYLEKYSVAPSPSRDYYGIKVIRDQVILYTWKISHGPHISPIVRISRFNEFNQDKTMHNEIQRVFGESMFRHVQTIAQGNEKTLLTLPKHLVKKLTTYLGLKDVFKLSTLSRMANEVFNGDSVWEVLYKRHKMGLIYRDEKEQGYSYGWKQLFKERQMHKPARERKRNKLFSSDDRLVISRSASTLSTINANLVSSKNQNSQKPFTTKLLGTVTKTRKFVGSKSNHNFNGRPRTANATNNTNIVTEKNIAKKPEESKNNLSTGFKSTKVTGISNTKFNTEDIVDSKAKKDNDLKPRNSLKMFCNLERKSNPSSARKSGSQTASNAKLPAQLGRKKSETSAKKLDDSKSCGKPVICKTDKTAKADFQFEEFVRASVTGKYSCPKNIGVPDLRRNSKFESHSVLEEMSAKKFSKNHFSNIQKESTIFQKFSTPRKPRAATNNECKTNRPEMSVKNFADIKVYLKSNSKNFCDDQLKQDGSKVNQNVKTRPIKKVPDNTTSKYENQNLLKTDSCKSLDSKFTSLKLSQRLKPKKRATLKK